MRPWSAVGTAVVLMMAVALTACSKAPQQTAQDQVVAVTRGTIEVSVASSGNVSLPHQATLTFGSVGTVKEVVVQEGAAVKAGQALASLDTASLEKAVAQAEYNLKSAQQALDETVQPADQGLSQAKAVEAVASARSQLQAAQDALGKAKAPYTDQDIKKQEEAVATAKSQLQAAQDALDKAKAPYTDQDVKKQEEAVVSAQSQLQAAQDALDKARAPYTPADVASASANVQWARETADNSQQQLENTQQVQAQVVSDASDLLASRKEAYRQVHLLKYGIFIPDADIFLDPTAVLAKYDANYTANLGDPNKAWKDLVAAKNSLATAQVQQAVALTAAQKALTQAQDALRNAQVTLDTMQAGPDTLDVALKEARVASAEAGLKAAEDTLATMKVGPDLLDVALKQARVASAEAGLKAAEDTLATMKAGPDPLDVALKEARVATAQATLSKAQEDLATATAGPDPLLVEQRKVGLRDAQVGLDDAKDRLAKASIKAPFDGVVAAVNVNVGDSVNASTAAVRLVDPTQVEVQAVVDEVDVLSIRTGQEVRLSLQAFPQARLTGTVKRVSLLSTRQAGIVSGKVHSLERVNFTDRDTLLTSPCGSARIRPVCR
ncbi:MAG: HlyD family efflux transporter periplasmic adaptor subunit [Chloroflexi bacterium]|nr:HlyD family efflux transporter periplasmic adaptor subunit [Chloroflexota bacterium]